MRLRKLAVRLVTITRCRRSPICIRVKRPSILSEWVGSRVEGEGLGKNWNLKAQFS
jgi:hypothetical protein